MPSHVHLHSESTPTATHRQPPSGHTEFRCEACIDLPPSDEHPCIACAGTGFEREW